MNKYGILLVGEEATYPIFECETKEQLEKQLEDEIKIWGVDKLRPVEFLEIKFTVSAGEKDKFDPRDVAILGGDPSL